MNIIDDELNEQKVKFYYYYFGDLRLGSLKWGNKVSLVVECLGWVMDPDILGLIFTRSTPGSLDIHFWQLGSHICGLFPSGRSKGSTFGEIPHYYKIKIRIYAKNKVGHIW